MIDFTQTDVPDVAIGYDFRRKPSVAGCMRQIRECVLIAATCTLLIGCGTDTKRKSPYDLYELRPVTGIPADNDSYYIAPRRAQCATIADNPSCGGGI